MTTVISIINNKGGVGKTTSTQNIGAALALIGHKVLLADLDPQCNLSQGFGLKGLPSLITEAFKNVQFEIPLPVIALSENLHLIPGAHDMRELEAILSPRHGREFVLRQLLAGIKDQYDYILLDCPPALNLLSTNALTTSNYAYIPMEADLYSFNGIEPLYNEIVTVKKFFNPTLEVGGVFLTKFQSNVLEIKEVAEAIPEFLGDDLMETRIRVNTAVRTAANRGRDIFQHDVMLGKGKESNAAIDYRNLTEEVVKRTNNGTTK